MAYEPNACTADVARRNMAGDTDFNLKVMAIAGETGAVALRREAGASWSTRIMPAGVGSDSVWAESLDSVIRRYAPVDILKVDIEGAEYGAFETCDTLDQVRLIVGETHASDSRSPDDFRALLTGCEILRWDLVDGTGTFVARRTSGAL